MKKIILGLFLGLLLALGLLVGGVVFVVKQVGGGEAELAANTLLVLDWSGVLPGHQIRPADADLGTAVTLSSVTAALREAAGQPEIKALIIDSSLELPREYLDELGAAVDSFRASGKPVLGHLELAMGGSYLAACLADTLALSPSVSGGLLLPGPGLSLLYMKQALAKLGVSVNVLHEGEAKGFGEQYAQQEMSPAVRQNLGGLVGDLLDEELAWIGARRHCQPAALKAELGRADRIWLTPREAQQIGLVDTLLSRADWEEGLETRFPGAERLSISDWIGSRKHLPASADGKPRLEDHIAVLWAEGNIVPGSSPGSVEIQSGAMIKQIRALKDADAVKAVVLRVESPGGSALAAEEIYQELVKLGGKKPLWISAGPVAASGGYYLSAPGKQIWVSPFSVMGSIGVVALVPDFSVGAAKLGLSPQSIHSLPAGKLGDLGSPVDPAILAALQGRMSQIYAEFRSRVLAHRPLSEEQLTPIGGGRVWTGRRAVALGLADRLGGLQACLDSLQASLGGKALPVADYPQQESLFSLLLAGRLKPRDLLPGARFDELAAELGGGDFVTRVAQNPALLADPRWSLRAELPIQLER